MAGIVLFGYSDVGFVCLDHLLTNGYDVRLVVTHEDDPGEAKWFRSVAKRAREAGVETLTSEIKDGPEVEARVAAAAPDLILSCYYRRMIPSRILAHAKRGAFNMHGSLLPRYRGRAPVNWAVLNGETEVGVTLHHMVKRADAGDIVDAEAVPVGSDETAYEAMTNVVEAARKVLARQIEALLAGTAPRAAQDESRATYFGGRKPEDGRIDWSWPTARIVNLVRAVAEPFPGAFSDAGDRRLFVWRARAVAGAGLPGTLLSAGPRPVVAAGDGAVELLRWSWGDGPRVESGALGLAAGTRIG
ncbi:MAG: formyltransferase [Rhodospirillales bacterium]|nr:formyltransferase [Rhodospirillales bacterium]